MNFADRVKETTTSTSAAVIVLSGAAATFRSFASSLTVGDTKIPVSMDDGKGNWENGEYTLTNATTLTRTAIYASSNGGAPTVFPAGVKEVFCTLSSDALNELISDLRAEIAAGGGTGVRDVAFATSVPLNVAGQAYMPQTSVTSALTFTPAAAAVRGALVYLRLVADGANLPNFAAFKEWGGSLGYDNRAGIVNEVQFFHDGVDSFVSLSQAIGATPAPIEASAVTMTGPTGGVVNVASSTFTVGTNAARSASLTVTPTPVTGVTFSPTSVTLPVGSATATFTATPSTVGAKSIAVTNSGGLTNPATITYTATASATVPAAPTIGTATAGDGYVDVAFTVGSNGGSAITSNTATLSTGETATGASSPIRVTAANGTARTATVTSTNGVGTGPASAASNSITPAAAAPTMARLTGLVKVDEAGTGPYTYTGSTTAGDFTSPGYGFANKNLPANTNGFVSVKITDVTPTSADKQVMLVLDSRTGFRAYDGLQFGVASRATYERFGVVSATAGAAITPAVNDVVRLARNGTVLTFDVSKDNGATWATAFTWSGVTTEALYANVQFGRRGAIAELTYGGFV